MKIISLNIKNYKQFTDLELDLTYPKGHDKEGEPLDKICIIGQSGTGKTNLLKIIRDNINSINVKIIFKNNKNLDNEKKYFIGVNDGYINTIEKPLLNINHKYQKQIDEIDYTLNEMTIKDKGNFHNRLDDYLELSKAKEFIEKKLNKLTKNKEKSVINNNKIINIHEEKNSWQFLKEKINNYEKEKTTYTKNLFNKMMHNSNYSKETSISDMKKWEKDNENILEKIADDINSIIGKFNLELKIDENTNSYEELIIKDLSNDNILDYEDISTGTKNLLSTFIPLKSYNPKDSIILIDEPENSFYPDIQRKLTDLYMNVGENNQLIMATHSPLIASSFEPWEVVELKFKNNQIYREKYYEGDNHVDNYILDPRKLTWTSILTDIFDLKEDSNWVQP